jgi:uncharacterized membrane protein
MTDSGFELTGGLPLGLLFVVGALLVGLSTYQFLNLLRRLPLRQAICLGGLRLGCYLVVFLFLMNPTLVDKKIVQLPARLAILVDGSQSMGLSYRDETRLDSVKRLLFSDNGSLLAEWARKYQIQLYRFDQTAQPLTPEALKGMKPEGKHTRLVESLSQITQGNPSDRPQALILFSDGITHEEDSAGEYRLSVPMLAVGIEEGSFRDNWIKEVRAPEFGFRDSPVRIDLTFVSEGYSGKEFPIYLYRGRNILATKTVQVSENASEQNVSFTFTPKEVGNYPLSVETPVLTNEDLPGNNQKKLTVEVLREKIRVLTLTGSPAWNYRFLRLALKRDPMVDLVSFVFLRTPTDNVGVPENQLSLIPFPIDAIFLEELKNFDLLIFDDFSHRPYFNWSYLEKVKDFVKEGGGFAMIGGGRSFDDGGYANTPLADILPVELTGQNRYQTHASALVTVTEAGRRHPVTRSLGDDVMDQQRQQRLLPLESFNRTDRVLFGQTLLAIGLDARQPNRGFPLLVVGKAGKGRVAAVMTDDLWKWNFAVLGAGGNNQAHLRLVGQMVRWLVKEPVLEQVQIVGISRPSTLKDKAEARVRVLRDDYTPAAEAALYVTLQGPDGEKLRPEIEPTGKGEFAIGFFPRQQGSFRIDVEARANGKNLGKAQKALLIRLENPESEDGKPRVDFLKRLAEKSGGEFLPLSKLTPKAVDQFFERIGERTFSRVVEEKQIRLWSTLPSLVGLLFLLSSEWALRRRWGLL